MYSQMYLWTKTGAFDFFSSIPKLLFLENNCSLNLK